MLKIVSQLLSISGRLKLTGESLLMSERQRVEFNEFKGKKKKIVLWRSGLEHYARVTVLGHTKSISSNILSPRVARSKWPEKNDRIHIMLALGILSVSSLMAWGLLSQTWSLCIQESLDESLIFTLITFQHFIPLQEKKQLKFAYITLNKFSRKSSGQAAILKGASCHLKHAP